jgi:DNA-directed RNA polymerase alpha subunit/DNA-directed RNA polymerase subunit L
MFDRIEEPATGALTFRYTGYLEVANALRRAILAEVPTLAAKYDPYHVLDPTLNDIIIKKNTTSLHDQILGQRISLIPIHMDTSGISAHRRSDLLFKIDAKNDGHEPINVTTHDITCIDTDGSPLSREQLDKLLPPDTITGDHPIIARLKHEHVFVCEFNVRRGIAREHAGFACVSKCAYAYEVDDKEALQGLNAKIAGTGADKEALAELKHRHETIDRFRYHVSDATGEPSSFLFSVDSECGMHPMEIVRVALETLANMVSMIPESFKVVESTKSGGYLVEILDADHTIGNLYQAFSDRTFSKRLSSIGYYVPHPHVRTVRVKLGFTDAEENIEKFIAESADVLVEHLAALGALVRKPS